MHIGVCKYRRCILPPQSPYPPACQAPTYILSHALSTPPQLAEWQKWLQGAQKNPLIIVSKRKPFGEEISIFRNSLPPGRFIFEIIGPSYSSCRKITTPVICGELTPRGHSGKRSFSVNTPTNTYIYLVSAHGNPRANKRLPCEVLC